MVTVALHLIGPPSLVTAGRAVRLHSAKTLALLAYLVLEADTPHSREKLACLLWGETSDERARHSLRQALYSLRRKLGELSQACLVMEEGTVAFRYHPDLWVDALEFQALATTAQQDVEDLRKAAHLYRGLLLEGLVLSDCPAFEEWLFFRRDALEQQALGVLDALVKALIRQGCPQKALVFAQRLVTLDPLHEGAHRRLMQIHAALGDPEAVRRQFRLCADILAREMGVEPTAETQALYHQLVATKASPAVLTEHAPASRPADRPLDLPFLGREHELAALQARLDQASAGQGGLILVAGGSGMGKTRLVTEFMHRSRGNAAVRAMPILWLTGRCYELEARAPYTMWADALQPLSTPDLLPLLDGLARGWRRELALLVPALGSPAPQIEGATPAESRLRLLQGVVQSLGHVARQCPLGLFFDDLHWADEASLELLHYVSRHRQSHPLLIIGAYRPDALAYNPPLARLLRGAGDVPQPLVLRLAPLDRETVGHLLAHLGVELRGSLPDRLHQHSDGNPFVLVETLRTLLNSGRLRRESDGLLVEVKEGTLPVPQRVQDLIQARAATLGEEHRRVLAAAAVIGHPFGLRLLRRVSGQLELQLLDLADQLLARAFFRETDDVLPQRSLDFHHNYIREVIYDGLGTVQRQTLHRRAAESLLALHQARPQDVTEEVARHYEQAGDIRAVAHLTSAAQQAEELFGYAQATELYSRALDFHSAHQADDLVTRFGLLLAREAVLDRQGRRVEQARDVVALVEMAETLADDDRLAIACVRQAGFFTYKGQYEEARQAGERALELYRATRNRDGEAQALRELGFLHWSAGDYGTALTYGRPALQLHRQQGDTKGEATALHNLAEIHRGLGSPRQALQLYRQAQDLYWARQDRRGLGLTLYGLAHALRQLGHPDQALIRYQEALTRFQASGDRLMVSRVHHALAGLQWEASSLNQALEHMTKALSISQEVGYGPGIAHGLIGLSHIHAQLDEADTARECLQEAMTWLKLVEDREGLREAQAELAALEQGTAHTTRFPASVGWVKSHVVLAEGKVYCEFESPLAQSRQSRPQAA